MKATILLLDEVLDGLLRRYRDHVPDVSAILDCMTREGFEAANADKIFESTYSSQTKKGAAMITGGG